MSTDLKYYSQSLSLIRKEDLVDDTDSSSITETTDGSKPLSRNGENMDLESNELQSSIRKEDSVDSTDSSSIKETTDKPLSRNGENMDIESNELQ
ncbi:hypothetical protein M5689_022587 [Euphorbia peplus]|nr:hypothetical protein M5689_022587 [Euphorbia peplus]